MELQTVSHVSKTLGISAQMLRYYERSGLVKSLRKEDYAYRVYDNENIRRLQQIVILRKLQISMKEIKNILETQQGTGTFISKTDLVVPEKEREDKLTEICTQFSSVAFSYGFNLDEVVQELMTIKTFK